MGDHERAIPLSDIGHPLADQVSAPGPDPWVATESRSPVVFFNQARASLVATARRDGRRPVLVTDELSVLSAAFANLWQRSGGSWVVREAVGGLRNGFDGRRLERIEDAWLLPPPASADDIAVNHLRPVAADSWQVSVILSVRHRAKESTVLGTALEQLAEATVGGPPLCWGPHEPVGAGWDRGALTRTFVSQLPDPTTVVAAAPDLAAVLGAQRTRHGVEELLHAYLRVGPSALAELERARGRISAVLSDLAGTSMPLVALVLARPGRGDLHVPPSLLAPPLPLGLLIGAPAVRTFGLDAAQLRDRFGAVTVGRPRIPGLWFDLGPFQVDAWHRLDAVLGGFDPEQLADALGLAGPLIEAARSRPRLDPDGGSRDAQP